MKNNTISLERKLRLLGLDDVTIESILNDVNVTVSEEADKAYDHGYKDGAYSTEAMNYWSKQN